MQDHSVYSSTAPILHVEDRTVHCTNNIVNTCACTNVSVRCSHLERNVVRTLEHGEGKDTRLIVRVHGDCHVDCHCSCYEQCRQDDLEIRQVNFTGTSGITRNDRYNPLKIKE